MVQWYSQSYRSYTEFRGWRLLPIVFMGSGATTTNVNETDCESMYHALSSRVRQGVRQETCVSLARAAGGGGAVCGRDYGRNTRWGVRLMPES